MFGNWRSREGRGKGKEGCWTVGLDKQVPTASWEGAVTWKRGIFYVTKKLKKVDNALIKGNRGLRLNFDCNYVLSGHLIISFVLLFAKKKYFEYI